MKKYEFMEFILQAEKCGVEKLYVYRSADGCGGYQHRLTLCEVHDDFTYMKFEGDLSDAVRHRSMVFVDHYEPFHERPCDVSVTLEELVLKFFALP